MPDLKFFAVSFLLRMDDNKPHRQPKAGAKAQKKDKNQEQSLKGRNPKAFAPTSGRNADRRARRKMDVGEKKLHVPLADRQLLKPPIIVVVCGPPKTGKTTLIKSLVKKYTKHSLVEIHGPVTVVASKTQRITFFECNNDINSMVDLGKVADLVLLTIDASFGFEMETFEFLNVLQTHGFPKVMGVLTHLDKFKDSKRLRKTKKRLKQRFWTEIYQGAKLFYLSGIINGKYPKNEILNLSRFISVMKFRPLVWRNTHPYILCDRMEDLTDPETVRQDPKCDRVVSVYGYLRGTNLKQQMKVHIPGLGDQSISSIMMLPDPCPIPDKQRKMSDKHKLIFAPMSDVGGILYDKDAIYINVPGQFSKREDKSTFDEEIIDTTEGERLVMQLQDVNQTIADKVSKSEMRLFSNSNLINASDFKLPEVESDYDSQLESSDEDMNDEDNESDLSDLSEDDEDDDSGRYRRKVKSGMMKEFIEPYDDKKIEYADSDSDLDFESDEEQEDETGDVFISTQRRGRINLYDFVYKSSSFSLYSDSEESEEEDIEVEDSIFTKKSTNKRKSLLYCDSVKVEVPDDSVLSWENEEMMNDLRSRFITGNSNTQEIPDENKSETDEEDMDFEDLENSEEAICDKSPEKINNEDDEDNIMDFQAEREKNARRKAELKEKFIQEHGMSYIF